MDLLISSNNERGLSKLNAVCLACNGTGKLLDDEGWQYKCSVCHGTGEKLEGQETKILSVDENNRLLD